jgi:D-3-phosphoglycerate dehydrogenase
MKKFKVLNTVNYTGCDDSLDPLRTIAEVDNISPNQEMVHRIIHEYDAYITTLEFRLDKELIDKASKLKVVVSPSTGTDHIDMAYLKSKGIICFDLSKEFELINTFSATSELAFTLLLALNRRLVPALQSVNDGIWGREMFTGVQLLGKTLGIVGLGRLGSISARIAKGFGMKVMATDIHDKKVEGVAMTDLTSLFKQADFITVHVHLNESTKHLINADLLESVKPGCILINTSRGALIDENALLSVLESGKLAAAGLDMIEGEWLNDIRKHPLVQYAMKNENLLITPHIGGATTESIYGARIFMANKLFTFLNEKIAE